MKRTTEHELIEGIKKGEKEIILFIMKKHAASVKKMVNEFKIERYIQAEDVIQDGMVELLINLRENKFNGNSSVTTYYYSICRFICLKHYNKYKDVYPIADHPEIMDRETCDYENDGRLDRLIDLLKHMKKECIEIINLRFGLSQNGQRFEQIVTKKGFDEISKTLNIEVANARQRFTRCLHALLVEYQGEMAKN